MSKLNDPTKYEGDLFGGVGGHTMPTRATLSSVLFRMAQVQSIIKAGDADYNRILPTEADLRVAAKGANYIRILWEGDWVRRDFLKARLKFLETWQARRNWLMDELVSLERSRQALL